MLMAETELLQQPSASRFAVHAGDIHFTNSYTQKIKQSVSGFQQRTTLAWTCAGATQSAAPFVLSLTRGGSTTRRVKTCAASSSCSHRYFPQAFITQKMCRATEL
jgi:hypothetical protein